MHAAAEGLQKIETKFSDKGQTFFGRDADGGPLYLIMNVGCKDVCRVFKICTFHSFLVL